MNGKKLGTERPSEVRHEYDRTWARGLFFRAMERVAPGVIKDLRDRLLPRFESLAPTSEEGIQKTLHGRGEEVLAEQLTPTVQDWGTDNHIFRPMDAASEYACDGPDLLSCMEPVFVLSFMRWSLQ